MKKLLVFVIVILTLVFIHQSNNPANANTFKQTNQQFIKI